MNSILLGIIEFEKDPPRYAQFGSFFRSWAMDAGGFAALALLLLVISQLVARDNSRLIRFNGLMKGFTVLAYLGYALYFGILLLGGGARSRAQMQSEGVKEGSFQYTYLSSNGLDALLGDLLFWSGLAAIIAFAIPFIVDALRMRWRRIFALAKLSFMESVRRRIVWVFFLFLIVFLFPAKWFFPIKPEDELRTSISVVHYGLQLLLILIALMLAAFSIPGDIKNQTIHTIVTKPVERFEILLGRFLGYVGLMTVALFGLTAISFLFISASKLDPLAEEESMKARLPKYGNLEFVSRKADFVGIDVGREKTYRKYIAGGETSSQRGLFSFDSVAGLTSQSAVPCEFAFDVYRLTKGEENKGIYTSFDLQSWKYDPAQEPQYQAAMKEAIGGYPVNVQPNDANFDASTNSARWEKVSLVAKKFGRFEYRYFPLLNNHTYGIQVPRGLFENAAESTPAPRPVQMANGTVRERDGDRLRVAVKCESPSQMLGIARYDLYLLEAQGSFTLNYFKGAVGLWCQLVLVIGLAVVCSTYLAGVISMLIAGFLFVMGFFLEFLVSLATGTNVGGGPLESLTKLVRGDVPAATLDKTPLVNVLFGVDQAFRWIVRRFFNIVPDVEKFAWSEYVSEGFSIRPELMAMNMLFLVGYLLPWFLIGYYMLKTREIAA